MHLSGFISDILTQKENDWGRYKIDQNGKSTLVVGIIPGASKGMQVEIEGDIKETKYGNQFHISSANVTADNTAGARKFLTEYLSGIGLKKAVAILKTYGPEAIRYFDGSKEGRQKITAVKGIKDAIYDKASESFEENAKYIDLILFLNGGTKAQLAKIFDKYGADALSVLKENPYRLQMDIDGFGFAKADALAKAAGIKIDSEFRIMAGAKYLIETAATAEGHCYLTIEQIRDRIAKLLVPMPKCEDITEVVAENALPDWPENKEEWLKKHNVSFETIKILSETKESRTIILDKLSEALINADKEGDLIVEDGHVYTLYMYNTEKAVAELIKHFLKERSVRYVSNEVISKCISDFEKSRSTNGLFAVTDEQKNAIYLGLMHRISVISGGPGRGKTTICKMIAESFLRAGSGRKDDILMLAPTGRAAQRITESTGYPAMTAHRAIAKADSTGVLPKDKLVIVDEASMIDIFLANKILEYAYNCNIIFVGDADQIPSIGPGNFLRDLIKAQEVPSILLKKGHRNTGTIARNAELINAGALLDRYCYDEHFVYIPSDLEHLKDLIIDDHKKMVKKYGMTEVMLCAAMRERGPVSVEKLNNALQEVYTKGVAEAIMCKKLFRIGDRVMQTKNNYDFILRMPDGTIQKGIFNGERGTVTDISYNSDIDSHILTVAFDDGKIGRYSEFTASDLVLAYATTIHKCQGSEAACMMMVYTYGDYMLLSRALFYTGETRAKKEFRFYGEEQLRYGKILSAFDIAVKNNKNVIRNTDLVNLIES